MEVKKLDKQKRNTACHVTAGDYLPSALVLCELKLHESEHGVEAKLDQSEVPTERLESFYGKYQLLCGETYRESQSR